LRKFLTVGCPVIIRGGVDDWPALEEGGENQWSVEYLKKVLKPSRFKISGFYWHLSHLRGFYSPGLLDGHY